MSDRPLSSGTLAVCSSEDAALFGNGMAAVTTAFLAVLRSDQHVVLTVGASS